MNHTKNVNVFWANSTVFILKRVVKVKVPHLRATKAFMAGRGIALPNLRPRHWRWGWVVGTSPRPLYSRERPGTHCTGEDWVGPRVGLDGCGKSRPPPGFDPRTVQPVASRYTGCVIPAPKLQGLGGAYLLKSFHKQLLFYSYLKAICLLEPWLWVSQSITSRLLSCACIHEVCFCTFIWGRVKK